MNNALNIIIALKQSGGQVLKGLSGGINRLNMSSQAYQATLRSLNGTANQFTGMLTRMAAVLGGADLFRRAAASGIAFNSTVEQSRIGIAALVRTFNTFTDSQGKAVSAQEAYTASMAIAERIQKELQIAGLETTATYEGLLSALQEGIGPAFKAGFNPAQIVKFTKLMTQAAASLSLPIDQLGQELRAVLDGTIDRNARIAKALGLTNEKIKELTKSGELFDYLVQKLKAFEDAGSAAAKTWTGAASNLADALQMAFGEGLSGSFKNATKMLLNLRDAIVTVDESAGTFTFNERIVAAFKEVDKAIGKVISEFGGDLKTKVGEIADVFANVAIAGIRIADAFLKITSAMGPALPLIVQIAAGAVTMKLAYIALVGPILMVFRRMKAFAAAIGVLGATKTAVAGLGALKAAILGVSGATATLTIQLRGFVAALAAYGVYEIYQLIIAIMQWRTASNEAGNAQDRLKKSTTGLMEKLKEYADYKPPEGKDLVGKTDEDLKKLQGDLSKARAYLLALKMQLEQQSEETNWLGNATAEAKNAAGALELVNRRLAEIDKARAAIAKNIVVAPPPDAVADPALVLAELNAELDRMKSANETMLLKLQEGYRLGKISLEKYFADRLAIINQEYGKEAALIARMISMEGTTNAERVKLNAKLFELEQAHARDVINLKIEQAKEAADIQDAIAQRAVERNQAVSETELAALKVLYDTDKVSLQSYIQKRSAILESTFALNKKIIQQGIAAETDTKKRMALEDELFALIEQHKRDILGINQELIDGEKSLALERAQAVQSMYQSIGTSSLESFEAQAAILDLQVERYKKLKIDQSIIDLWYKNELENILRQQALNSDRFYDGIKQAHKDMIKDQDRLGQQGYDVYNGMVQNLTGTLSSFFDDVWSGQLKSAADYFRSFAKGIVKAWSDMASQMMAKWLMMKAMKGFSGFFGLGGEVGGGSGSAVKLASGGRIPGHSPHSRADNIPIWATAGEYVHPVSSVQYYGSAIMEAIRRRLIPKDFFAQFALPASVRRPSYALASGGEVPGAPGAFSVSVPVTVSGADNVNRLSRVLPGEIEALVIQIMRREMR
ncbi:MAG: hypothetical protein RBT11_19080 [Desulfobacterales bacterium]|jgi:hypothetical protein|nr:hypothetical protein [Desulfobacterales bacterium]